MVVIHLTNDSTFIFSVQNNNAPNKYIIVISRLLTFWNYKYLVISWSYYKSWIFKLQFQSNIKYCVSKNIEKINMQLYISISRTHNKWESCFTWMARIKWILKIIWSLCVSGKINNKPINNNTITIIYWFSKFKIYYTRSLMLSHFNEWKYTLITRVTWNKLKRGLNKQNKTSKFVKTDN